MSRLIEVTYNLFKLPLCGPHTVPSVTSRLPNKGVLIGNKDDHGSFYIKHIGIRKHQETIDTDGGFIVTKNLRD
jgi:hypothetical protein